MYTAMKKDGTHTIILYNEGSTWWRRDVVWIPITNQTVSTYNILKNHVTEFAIIDELSLSPDWITAQHNPQEKPLEPEADHARD